MSSSWTSKVPSNAGAGTNLRLLSYAHYHYLLQEEPGPRPRKALLAFGVDYVENFTMRNGTWCSENEVSGAKFQPDNLRRSPHMPIRRLKVDPQGTHNPKSPHLCTS
jgi:hypothetical protein